MTNAETLRMQQLEMVTQGKVWSLIDMMADRGFDVFVGATRRTPAEVEAARLAGRSSAKQTRSWHELGRAADLRPRKKDGGPNYDTGPESLPFWRALQTCAEATGMRCLAFRPDGSKLLLDTVNGKRWDPGHVEWRASYASLKDALQHEAVA